MARKIKRLDGRYVDPFFIQSALSHSAGGAFDHTLTLENSSELPGSAELKSQISSQGAQYARAEPDAVTWLAVVTCVGYATRSETHPVTVLVRTTHTVQTIAMRYRRESWSNWEDRPFRLLEIGIET